MAADTLTTCKPTSYNLSSLFSFIVSHPLYFSYFIFFSPYLFKFILFIFISPLFLTTSLFLILSIIATTLPHSNLGFLTSNVNNFSICSKVTDGDQQHEEFREFEDLEIYKTVFNSPPLLTVAHADDDDDDDGEDNDVTLVLTMQNSVAVMDEQRSLERLFQELDRFEGSAEVAEMSEIKSSSHMEENIGEFQKLVPISDESSFSVNSNSSRSESSRSFGSCGSIGDETTTFEKKNNETKSYVEKVVGELQKSNSTVAVEVKNHETTSHVRKMLLKLEPVTSSFSDEDQKPVKSISTASIQTKDNETTSYVRKVLQKNLTAEMSISGEDQKTVKSNSTETTSYVRKVLQKNLTAEITIAGEDQKTVKSNSTETTSHVKKMLQKLEPVPVPVPVPVSDDEDQKPVQNTFSLRTNSWRLDSSSSFGSYGSMRKEKEWKRTLACKLFEERNNSERGEEGMDSLWEAYEDDNSSKKSKNRKEEVKNEKKMMMKSKKKSEFKCFEDEDEDGDGDGDEEFMRNGQLCCLKALKLSTGKMNLGMGKPNLVKISKAIKGFGWLHHVGSSKHGKKT